MPVARRDEHAVGIRPEHVRVREELVDGAARLEEDVPPLDRLVEVDDVRARAARVGIASLGAPGAVGSSVYFPFHALIGLPPMSWRN